MDFSILDIILGVILLFFAISGYRSGLIKKIFVLVGLALALILATKFSADISEMLTQSFELPARIGFGIAFIVIILTIMLLQSLLYNAVIHDAFDKLWNKLGGVIFGLFEGTIILSILLILLTIYFRLPSNKQKQNSVLYKPVKNFAPLVYDSFNTFLPESEDFYQELLKHANEGIKKVEEKLK